MSIVTLVDLNDFNTFLMQIVYGVFHVEFQIFYLKIWLFPVQTNSSIYSTFVIDPKRIIFSWGHFPMLDVLWSAIDTFLRLEVLITLRFCGFYRPGVIQCFNSVRKSRWNKTIRYRTNLSRKTSYGEAAERYLLRPIILLICILSRISKTFGCNTYIGNIDWKCCLKSNFPFMRNHILPFKNQQ